MIVVTGATGHIGNVPLHLSKIIIVPIDTTHMGNNKKKNPLILKIRPKMISLARIMNKSPRTIDALKANTRIQAIILNHPGLSIITLDSFSFTIFMKTVSSHYHLLFIFFTKFC